MATFTILPSYSVNLTTKARVRNSQFGDGYSQRVADGINTQTRMWSLRFQGGAARLDPVESFLQAEGGITSFNWTPPVGSAGKWVCSEWSRSISGYNKEVLTATFSEVFGE